MHVLSIGFFAPDYLIALANALGKTNAVTLFLSKQNLASYFPDGDDLDSLLRERKLLEPGVSLRLIDHPSGRYLRKIQIAQNLVGETLYLKPDVVHFQLGGDPWLPLTMMQLRRFPLVATIHDAITHPGGSPPPAFVAATNFLGSRLAHQIIVHGKQQAKILTDWYRVSPDKLNVIPIGCYEVLSPPSNLQAAQPESNTVLFFGRLRKNKGIDILLRAVPLIAARVPNVHFIIAGAGDYPAVSEAAAKQPDLFELHNRFIKAEEVHTFFHRAALVVAPYTEASQSGVLPQAYMFSRPVVATRVGSLPEVVDDGETGILIEPNNERELAEAVVGLLLDPALCQRMGEKAKTKLEQDLSWNAIAEKTLATYKYAQARM